MNGDRKLKESIPSPLGYIREIDNFREDSFAKKEPQILAIPDNCELVGFNTITKNQSVLAKEVLHFDFHTDGSII